MSSKKDNKKDKDSNKNRKRDQPDPDEKEWSWDDTALADPHNTSLLAQDVKTLLISRGEKKTALKGKKIEMIEFLKEKYDVDLKEDFETLTVNSLKAELRLRKLDDSNAQKKVLIQRLTGEIDATAPPPKKRKKGRAPKSVPKVYVPLYTPAATAEEASTKVLGVYKSERKAYEKGRAQLIEDLEDKYGDKKKKKVDAAIDKMEEIPEDDFKARMESINQALIKAYGGKEDDAPYVDIVDSQMVN